MKKIKYVLMAILAFIVCMNAFLLPAYASTGDDDSDCLIEAVIDTVQESMAVNATWLDDDLLRVDVTDLLTGAVSSLAMHLGDFISDASNNPYVLLQAADLLGNLSGVIQVNNPFYIPADDYGTDETADEIPADEPNESGGYSGVITFPQSGLTPDGTGTVVDNIVTQSEIEFFTVYTEEGNVFYLVVDRLSSTENVHLLNAVTEADLMALAERSGNPIVGSYSGAIPSIVDDAPPPETDDDPPQEQEPDPPRSSRNNNSNLILIGVVVAVVGGAAYYFKIVRPKKNAVSDDEEYGEDDSDYSDNDNDEENFDEYEEGGDER